MVIAPATYSDGTYKASEPQVLFTRIIELSYSERRQLRRGRRGCSCYGIYLTDLAVKCVNLAAEYKAMSWGIYPIPGQDAVYVEFYNWPTMGLCNFDEPVKRTKNYWWDIRPVPKYIAPSDPRAVRDDSSGGMFDPEA